MKNLACSKSWTDVNIDFKNRKVGHCCKSSYYDLPDDYTPDFFTNSETIQQRRKDSLNGIKHSDCQKCWTEIDNGNVPFMEWMNEWDSFDHVTTKDAVNYIEIDLDNTCDLACLYCTADFSSKIAKEEGVKVEDNTRQKDIEIYKQWLVDTVNKSDREIIISFLGGEPTASKFFYELLDHIVTCVDTSKIRLEVMTNGNSKKFLLDKFLTSVEQAQCKLNLHVSNESFKENSELIRYGLDWKRFEENIHTYASCKSIEHINFDMTMTVMALPTFPQYVKWLFETLKDYDKTFSFFALPVAWPKEMDLAILPTSFRKYIDETIQIVNEQNDKKFEQHCRKDFLGHLDSLRKRIGSNYREDYKEYVKSILEKKQKIKKTDKLIRLLNVEGLS